MSDVNTYTAAEIQRYHNGEMTAAEMHSLEKAALDDPMLADAIEGYTHTTKPTADLQNLQRRLQQRVSEDEKGKVAFLNSQWLKIAAVFIVIAGGGWLVLQTFTSQNDNIATMSRDTASLNNETVTAATGAQEAASPEATISTAPSAATTDAAGNSVARSQVAKGSTEMKEAKQGEVAAAPSTEIATLKDNTAVRAGSTTTGDTTNGADVVLQREEAAPVNMTASKNRAKARERAQSNASLQPDGGWAAFEKYIATNRKLPASATVKAPKGDVVLSFDVNLNGRPVNIFVSKSLCEACDIEAIRLVKEGPSWSGSGAKGMVTISF